jgi:hypothetical protein
MTESQKAFLANMTIHTANDLLRKFRDDPARAASSSDAAYVAFCQAWELANDGEYIQRYRADRRTEYRFIQVKG